MLEKSGISQSNARRGTSGGGWGELRLYQTGGGGEIDREVVKTPEEWGSAWERLREESVGPRFFSVSGAQPGSP
jgi:hypothetical protein